MSIWLGVDIGGTFTDLVVYNSQSGSVRVAKGLSVPEEPEKGVLNLLNKVLTKDVIADASFFIYGTTTGLNTLLERKGALVGVLSTEGFRDVLEIRRGCREAHDDALWVPPPPLVPRRRRLPIAERIRSDGTVKIALDKDSVEQAFNVFEQDGVDSIAVTFINAYANPEHELSVERLVREMGFKGSISLSHRISGEYREYERTSTTVVDAYVRPRTEASLKGLEETMSSIGFNGEIFVMSSAGGVMPIGEAIARSFQVIQAGPVGGVVGVSTLCRELGIQTAIAADVGGTSFDTCLIVNGQYTTRYEGKVMGMPLQTPWVDVRSIGAGGGSIAFVDHGGLLRVGERSAGAMPGPACYGRGGQEPTVTDAAAVLNMLGFGELAGNLTLYLERGRKALLPLADRLAMSVEDVAYSILRIQCSSMANAIGEVTVGQGQDVRFGSLVMYGGAGPLFGTLLADELEIDQIIVPNYPGTFSAWGLLVGDITRSASRTSILPLDESGLSSVNQILHSLFDELALRGEAKQVSDLSTAVSEGVLEMRHKGQEFTFPISLDWNGESTTMEVKQLHDLFTREYEARFNHTVNADVEIVTVRAIQRFPLPQRPKVQADFESFKEIKEMRSIDAYSFSKRERTKFAVIDRASLETGHKRTEPCIIIEESSVTYVDSGFELEVHPTGTLIINRAKVK